MKKYDVYAIGNAVVDYEIETNDQFLKDNGVEKAVMTLVDGERQLKVLDAAKKGIKKKEGGGSAANSIVATSMLGGKCFYSCKVANDEDGHFFLKDLLENGVDTNLDKNDLDEGVTGKVLIMVTPDAERTMNTFLGITTDFSTNEIREEALLDSKYLFIEGYLIASETGRAAMKEAKKIAEDNGIKVSLTFSDPSMVKYFKDEMTEVVGEGVDLLFCNEEEAMLYTGKDSVAEAREALKAAATKFVITQGKNGAMIWDGDTFIDIEPYPVAATDTTGAGDMFSGAFLYGITHGHTLASAGTLASKTSSAVVAKFGPRMEATQLQAIKEEVFQVD